MKKVNKNNLALQSIFSGQLAPSPSHCERSAQIICIGAPPTNLGFFLSSRWFVGLSCSDISTFHTQNLTRNGFGVKIWSSQHELECPYERTSQLIK
jgi:hypothetical protein